MDARHLVATLVGMQRIAIRLAGLTILATPVVAQSSVNQLPPEPRWSHADWLIDPAPFRAGVFRTSRPGTVSLSNGLIRREFKLEPNAATIGFDQLTADQALCRAVEPEALVTLDGVEFRVGGLIGQPNHSYLAPEWVEDLEAEPGACRFIGFEVGTPRAHLAWKRVRHHAPNAAWPPLGAALRLDFAVPAGPIRVSVHYELYDGVPCLAKWIEVHNDCSTAITVDRFTSESLAVVEYGSSVESRAVGIAQPNIHVETDYAFASFTAADANHHAVHWLADPGYATQVNYQRTTPCLLRVGPTIGPAQRVAPATTFTSFRTLVLPYDSYDRERRGLSLRRVYRTVAPWVTENPLMMHVRYADRETVERAIDQCAAVGFELVILTFGSGFDIEDRSDAYLDRMRAYADYARERGVEIGGYSLLASRSVGAEHDVVMPDGEKPRFGNSPCLQSAWGREYFDTLYRFYERTGFALLEHDGSYPGDPCTSKAHPGHVGHADSRWTQWRRITDFYRWCRGRGIYLNVPDYYYLSGSSKCGMGYRETNWSLPRDQQVIHTRQNIYDGSWEKTPSMGWMFVPLTEYHGGGAAATIEPLREHLDHYARMLDSNLALGVQACYRGPRLYDTDATRDLVAGRVAWFKQHRAILESDLVHGRRADGRDVDWLLHVNPQLDEKGMLVAFNPLAQPVTRTIRPDLYYTGLRGTAVACFADGTIQRLTLGPRNRVEVSLSIPARSMRWVVFSE